MRGWIVCALLAGLFGCSDGRSGASTNPNGLVADQVIKFASFSFGCTYESQFRQALDHYARKEITAWAGIITSEPDCISDSTFKPDPTINWAVLQIRGEMMQVGIASARDFSKMRKVLSTFDPDRKYWTLVSYGVKTADSVYEYQENISNPIVKAAPASPQSVTSRNGKYVILIAALGRDARANELQAKFKETGIKGFSRQVVIDDVRTMRLQAGPFQNKKKAEEAMLELNKSGLGGVFYPDVAQ